MQQCDSPWGNFTFDSKERENDFRNNRITSDGTIFSAMQNVAFIIRFKLFGFCGKNSIITATSTSNKS